MCPEDVPHPADGKSEAREISSVLKLGQGKELFITFSSSFHSLKITTKFLAAEKQGLNYRSQKRK